MRRSGILGMGGDEGRVVGRRRGTAVRHKFSLQYSGSVCLDSFSWNREGSSAEGEPFAFVRRDTRPILDTLALAASLPEAMALTSLNHDRPFRAQAHRPFLPVLALDYRTGPGLGRDTATNLAHRSGGSIATEIGGEKGGGQGDWQESSTGSGRRTVGRGVF
jgi:hypothetical protein